jgi:hypothetical protein
MGYYLSDDEKARIHKLNADGWTQETIAAEIGRSQSTVGLVLDPAVAERKREANSAWQAANPERCRENSIAWNAANRERKSENDRAWNAANPIKVAMQSAKQRAKRFGVSFDPAIEQELGEYPDRCPVCHVEMVSHIGEGRMQSDSPSVDRILPELGYVPGNVQWLCLGCNRIKQDDTMEDLRARRAQLPPAA